MEEIYYNGKEYYMDEVGGIFDKNVKLVGCVETRDNKDYYKQTLFSGRHPKIEVAGSR